MKRKMCLASVICIITLCITNCENVSKKDIKAVKDIYNEAKDAIEKVESVKKKVVDMKNNVEKTTDNEENNIELTRILTEKPSEILVRTAYTTSYNKETKLPNWVAWCLTAEKINGTNKRNGVKFHEDEDVSTPRATHFDYMNSGYDRGHMCPSADNKWSAKAQEESFLMTNICPQLHNLNADGWNELEITCRKWAQEYGKIYIVCGPIMFNKKHKTIGKNKIAVPDAFFKVILRTGSNPQAIGFIYRNEAANKKKNDYVNSVDEVERITGYDFFYNLPDDVEQNVEKKVNISQWSGL